MKQQERTRIAKSQCLCKEIDGRITVLRIQATHFLHCELSAVSGILQRIVHKK